MMRRACSKGVGHPKDLIMLPSVGHRFRREPAAVESRIEWLEGILFG